MESLRLCNAVAPDFRCGKSSLFALLARITVLGPEGKSSLPLFSARGPCGGESSRRR